MPGHRSDLRFVGHVIAGHRYMMVGAAEESGTATLFVPVLGTYELPAESSLSRDSAAAVLDRLETEGADRKRLTLKEVRVELRRLDDLGLDPNFVKIDVEGAELAVLSGLGATLERSRPALMIERSDCFQQVASRLRELSYAPYVYDAPTDELRQYDGEEAVNVFFLQPSWKSDSP